MENIPQPAADPYAPGDRGEIHLSEADRDAAHHGTDCIVVDPFQNDLPANTAREVDAYTDRQRPVDVDTPLAVEFRHFDLIPVSD